MVTFKEGRFKKAKNLVCFLKILFLQADLPSSSFCSVVLMFQLFKVSQKTLFFRDLLFFCRKVVRWNHVFLLKKFKFLVRTSR